MDLDSKFFKDYGDPRISETDVDLSSCRIHFVNSDLQIDKTEEDIILLEYIQNDNPSHKYLLKLSVVI